jgi:TRAP-type uncharacterized transport system fused permease subunit
MWALAVACLLGGVLTFRVTSALLFYVSIAFVYRALALRRKPLSPELERQVREEAAQTASMQRLYLVTLLPLVVLALLLVVGVWYLSSR